MTTADYKKAASELRAARIEFRYHGYVIDFTRAWKGGDGSHMGFQMNLTWEQARTLARSSARAQVLADIHMNKCL